MNLKRFKIGLGSVINVEPINVTINRHLEHRVKERLSIRIREEY